MGTSVAPGSPRAMWALGDYHRFAKATVWELGEVLVDACGVQAGQRVLDVAAGDREHRHPRCRAGRERGCVGPHA
jgi:hypothetical protein